MNPMAIQAGLLVLGLMLLIKGGDLFVGSAVRIAEFMRMRRVVIGSTLVSLATTTPELVVSIMAAGRNEPGLAVGNAVGSVVCNIGLVLGLTAALKHVDVHPPALRRPLIVLFTAGLILFFMSVDLVISRWQGMVLLTLGIGYFAYDFMQNASIARSRAIAEARAVEEAVVQRVRWLHSRLGTAVQFAFAAGIVVLGSRLLVDSAVTIAAGLGIPSIIIGLTVVAIGTSLPELITALTSSRKAVTDLAVGNVLGANIANLTIIVGAAASVQAVTMSRVTQLFNFPVMLGLMVLLLWMLLSERKITRTEGAVLLLYYAGYLGALTILTVWTK